MRPLFHAVLLRPQIPPNAGNAARTCAALGARLHLVGPLGFAITDAHLKRAGLDYWPKVDWKQYPDWAAFRAEFLTDFAGTLWLIDNPAPRHYTDAEFQVGDAFLFGGEVEGLPADTRAEFAASLVDIPMPTGNVRSLNLSTSVGVVLYEALRQTSARHAQ